MRNELLRDALSLHHDTWQPESILDMREYARIVKEEQPILSAFRFGYVVGEADGERKERRAAEEKLFSNLIPKPQTVTLYNRRIIATGTPELVKPTRKVLHNAILDRKADGGTYIKLADQPGVEYVSCRRWTESPDGELAGIWTVDPCATIIVPYEIGHEFEWLPAEQTEIAEKAFLHSTLGAARVCSVSDRRNHTEPHICIFF